MQITWYQPISTYLNGRNTDGLHTEGILGVATGYQF